MRKAPWERYAAASLCRPGIGYGRRVKGIAMAAVAVAACASDDRVNELEKRIDALEKETASARSNDDRRFERLTNDVEELRLDRGASEWWCIDQGRGICDRTRAMCERDRGSLGECVRHRIAFCGQGACYGTLDSCDEAAGNLVRTQPGGPRKCVGVE